MLKEYLEKRPKTLKSDLLFQSRSGKPLQRSNILRRTLHPILDNFKEPKCGCHAFRRFRVTHLRKNGVPEDLIHFWAGHAGKSVTDDYSKLKDDLVFRKEVAIRVGLGFELPSKKTEDGPNGPKIETKPISKMAAWFDSREISGAPGEIRTPDPLLRRQTLYPTELRALC